MFSELSVSTGVVVGKCDSNFDINSIYQYLNIDTNSGIASIKCNNKQKTKTFEMECKTFYNQITISMVNKQNVKLFNNGKFQVSGVKSVDEASNLIKKLIHEISIIKGTSSVKTQYHRGLYVYKNKILRKDKNGDIVCSNTINNDKIIFDGCEVEEFKLIDGVYCDKKHTDKTKRLYNNNCDEIGIARYSMKRKLKNLCLKSTTYSKKDEYTWDIINKYNTVLGQLSVEFYKQRITPAITLGDTVDLVYSACSNTATSITDAYLANVNLNFKLLLISGETLDREAIVRHLNSIKEVDISVIYDSTRYPGIKFILGNTRVTIFRTGSIIFSTKEDVNVEVIPFLKDLFEKNDFIKKSKRDVAPAPGEKVLSIWDI